MRLCQALRGSGKRTFTPIATATSTSGTISTPASTKVGDLLILADLSYRATLSPTAVTPAGFTSIMTGTITYNSNYYRSNVSYGLATANGTYSITGMDATTDNKALLVIRPSSPIVSVTDGVSGTMATGSGTESYNSASDIPTGIVIVGMFGGVDTPTTNGDDQLAHSGGAASRSAIAAWMINSAGDLGTHSMTDNTFYLGKFSGYLGVL
jgi:hypothetical protein